MHESRYHAANCMLTLTLDDEHLTFGNKQATLVKRDLQLFWKRLRKGIKCDVRYFACGEYGSNGSRPHYHAILFGYDFPDKVVKFRNPDYDVYVSESLDRLWGNGLCSIGALSPGSAAYVARYILDKALGSSAKKYERLGIEPEFVVMSRRPGIGSEWYDKYEADIFPRDSLSVRGHASVPPKYYSRRYEASHPLDIQDVKEKRIKRAQENWEENEPKRLKVREHVKRQAIKNLNRNAI